MSKSERTKPKTTLSYGEEELPRLNKIDGMKRTLLWQVGATVVIFALAVAYIGNMVGNL